MFTEALWQQWSKHELSNYSTIGGLHKYLKKGYTHFDHRFWFPERNDELKKILQNGLKVKNKATGKPEFWPFSPFLKVLIKTPRYRYQEIEGFYDLETKVRPICFASHIDSLIFSFYAYCLTKTYEDYIHSQGFADSILAYRSDLGNSNIQFSKEIFEDIRKRGKCSAVALDIKGYFDHIDHSLLREKWLKILGSRIMPEDQFRLYKVLTHYSYVNKTSIYKEFRPIRKRSGTEPRTLLDLIPGKMNSEKFRVIREKRLVVVNEVPDAETGRFKGVPQGSAMSALLSNIYLIDFDKMMYDKAAKENFVYKRYCDDILIVGDTERANELQDYAISKIQEDYFQTIQKKKVEVIDFHLDSKARFRAFKRHKNDLSQAVATSIGNEQRFYKPLQYLGFEFNGQDIFIRSSSLSRYFRKMRARIVKTVSMSYSPKSRSKRIFKKQIFERYTHLGKRNFLTYAAKASAERYQNSEKVWKQGMNSPAIKRQISRHLSILMHNLDSKSEQRFQYKESKGKGDGRRII